MDGALLTAIYLAMIVGARFAIWSGNRAMKKSDRRHDH
jgi:hypothetical protein